MNVPVELPPIDSTMPAIDVDTDWLARSVRQSLTSGNDGTRGGEGSPSGGTVAIAERGAIAMPGNPRPDYPHVLRAARVEGEVLAEFVIDTAGRVERRSVRIIGSSHPLFEAAVREVIPQLRFLPAEAGGRKVRQLVRQPFGFRVETVP